MKIAKVLDRDSADVPVDQPCVRVAAAPGLTEEPTVRLWTRNGIYSSVAHLDPAAHAELIEALKKAGEEAWG